MMMTLQLGSKALRDLADLVDAINAATQDPGLVVRTRHQGTTIEKNPTSANFIVCIRDTPASRPTFDRDGLPADAEVATLTEARALQADTPVRRVRNSPQA